MATQVPTATVVLRTVDAALNRVQDNIRGALDPVLKTVNALFDGTGLLTLGSSSGAIGATIKATASAAMVDLIAITTSGQWWRIISGSFGNFNIQQAASQTNGTFTTRFTVNTDGIHTTSRGTNSGGTIHTVTNAAGVPAIAGLEVSNSVRDYFGPFVDISGNFVIAQDQNAGGLVRAYIDPAGALHTANGIKSLLGPLTYWNTAYAAGSPSAVIPLVNGATASTAPWSWVAPFAGSIVGFSGYNSGATSANASLAVSKNGSALATISPLIVTPSNFGWATATKGTYAFAAGDTLTATFTPASAGNFALQAYLAVEMNA